MRALMNVGVFATLCVLAEVAGAQEMPEMPKPAKEHEALAKFAGEWDVKTECKMPTGGEPIVCTGTEDAKIVGGFWLVTHGEGDMMGTKMTSILTLGYSPQKKKYVGTFVNSCDSTLWTYEGEMDASGKKLTLHTEGPHMTDPTKKAKYREVLELVDKDYKTFTSHLIDEKGQETKVVTMEYVRKKK